MSRRSRAPRAQAPVYFYRFTTSDYPEAVTFGISSQPTLRGFFYAYDGPFEGFTDLHVFTKVGHGEVFEDTLKRWGDAMVTVPRPGRWTESYRIEYHETVTSSLRDHGAIEIPLPRRDIQTNPLPTTLPQPFLLPALISSGDKIRRSLDPCRELGRAVRAAIRSTIWTVEAIVDTLGTAAIEAGVPPPEVERIIEVQFAFTMAPLQSWEPSSIRAHPGLG